MDWKKFTVATIIGGIVYFLLGWLLYGIILSNTLALPDDIKAVIEYPPEEFKISLMLFSCLAFGGLLSLILLKWANVSTFEGGVKIGAIIGALISLYAGLSMASMYNFASVQNTLIDMVGNAVVSGITAGLIGLYLGRGKAD